MLIIANGNNRKSRKKADSPTTDYPAAPPPTPPYETREKPEGHASKGGRRSMRRPAEAGEFPWNRDIDFQAAKANATWDESIYDPATLRAMEQTRVRNEAVIARIDQAESERQRKFVLALSARYLADMRQVAHVRRGRLWRTEAQNSSSHVEAGESHQ